MKKLSLFSVAVLILLFALAPVHAQIITPTSYDFGDVVVGESATTVITTFNDGFDSWLIDAVFFSPSIGDFSCTTSLFLPDSQGYLESMEITVVFTPSSVGEFSADLVIQNGEQFIIPISGTGVPTLPSTIEDIIDNFDAFVADGSLVGTGAGASADGRLNALRNMLNQASYLIGIGDYEAACGQLNAALKRCDDFIQGTAVSELKQMISDLMNELGC